MKFITATSEHIKSVAEIALKLWPSNTIEDLILEFSTIIENDNSKIFLVCNESEFIGFAQCSLRFDYVEGTDSCPVGYFEGIFVKEEYRNKGIGKELLRYCEEWAKMKGAEEFASDSELKNTDSLKFHLNIGFKDANRIICFVKNLK